MAKVTITNPPPFTTNRRKCGWGSVITTCDFCGKMMIGHNKGICTRCMRSLVGDHTPHERTLFSRHIGYHAFKRDLANGAKALALAASAAATAKRNRATTGDIDFAGLMEGTI